MTARIAFFGMDSAFSVRALEALVDGGVPVPLVIRPKGGLETRREVSLTRDRPVFSRLTGALERLALKVDLAEVARKRGIPSYAVGDASHDGVRELLAKERIDGVAIAFFNQLLRPSLLARMPLGALNAHPSLLPALRGPAPLFWTFRDGHDVGGLSVHVVAPGEDDGAIVFQEPVSIPFGTPGEAHVRALTERVGLAMITAVRALVDGKLAPRAQDEAQATRAPRPTDGDRLIHPDLGARRVFHFVRGFGRFQCLEVELDGARRRVIDAIDLDEERAVPADHAIVGDTLLLACRPGMVALRLDPTTPLD